MGSEKKAEKKAAKAAKKAHKAEPKEVTKARREWTALEDAINKEFTTLVRDGFDMAELETLRWDYRYDKLPEYKAITQQQLEFFVAESEARAANVPPPRAPWDTSTPQAAAKAGAKAPLPADAEYRRKSQVDIDLVEKYLEKRVSRDTRSELEAVYKETFGEDLVVPKHLDLVDLTYLPSDVSDADRQRKLSKSEILGTPEEGKPADAKKDEAAVEAAPTVKKESGALAFATAFKKGVPPGAGFGSKWSLLNPLHLWIIPKKYCGSSVPRYYLFFLINLVLTVLLFIPRIILWPILLLYKILKRFVAPKAGGKLGAKIKGFQDKLAETAPKPDADKASAPAKSS